MSSKQLPNLFQEISVLSKGLLDACIDAHHSMKPRLAGDSSQGEDAELVTVLRERGPELSPEKEISYINPSSTTQARGTSQKRRWKECTSHRMRKCWVLSSVTGNQELIVAVVTYRKSQSKSQP